ncbi:MAG: DNA polymerase III subunit alpha [Thermomicrobiales bacterium]
MPEFAHLHLHTEYSLLDGMGRIPEYIEQAQESGIQHLAVTDHGVMYAAYDFYKQVSKAGLHPIVGMEAYFAEGKAGPPPPDASEAERKARRKAYHLLLLAENETGYRNLMKLASQASLNGFYYRPRIDIDMLARHHDGIIATSACLGGPLANNLLNERPDTARDYAVKLAEIFGRERFFVEIQDHGLKEQLQVNRDLISLAKSFALPLVVTNDVHYCKQADSPAQELLVCIQTNTTLNDPKRLKPETDELYLKSPQEMWNRFAELPDGLKNSMRIAEMCQLDLSPQGFQLPDFDVPAGYTNHEYLEHLVRAGAAERYDLSDSDVENRIAYELRVIGNMNLTNYFLVVWDFVRFAKENDIPVGPGRGSAAGSIVTYCLAITSLDPLKHGLIFERFLNPDRLSLPDIDIDFADDRRDEVIQYVVGKYGDDRVAQISTFGTMAARASLRDVGRAMGMPFSEIDRVAKLIPAEPKMTIEKALDRVAELNDVLEADKRLRELVDNAKKVEGIARHSSTHAAGVVISRDPLIETVPLQRASGKSEGEVTTQYQMGLLEEIGLLKMDFLGLTTLTILRRAVDLARRKSPDLTIDAIPLEDEEAFLRLQQGDTIGVFQLEGGMTTRMTTEVAPNSFDDLIALMALIRPGPAGGAAEFCDRKHGRSPVTYMHPDLEPILKGTFGIAVYQEQIMQIANAIAGFSMADADGLRSAMGKKKQDLMESYRKPFIEGAVAHGLTAALADELYSMMARFGGYGFNKAHSAAYAVIAAQTAYLKAHYPVEFMCALMTTDGDNHDRLVSDVAHVRRMGHDVLGPDINRSELDFQPEIGSNGKESIRYGLSAIKNVGKGAAESILKARCDHPNQEFASLEDFCSSVDWTKVSRKVADSLAKSGALDCFGPRSVILNRLEPTISGAIDRQRAAAKGQLGFDMLGGSVAKQVETPESITRNLELPLRQRLSWERELLGIYLSDHPVNDVLQRVGSYGRQVINDVHDRFPGDRVRIIGRVDTSRRFLTKANKTMAIMDFEDMTGTIELVAFPETYQTFQDAWEVDNVIEVEAKVDLRGEKQQLICERVFDSIDALGPRPSQRQVHIALVSDSSDANARIDEMQRVLQIIREHDGDDEVVVHLRVGEDDLPMRSRTLKVEWNELLQAELQNLLGEASVWVEPIRDAVLAA